MNAESLFNSAFNIRHLAFIFMAYMCDICGKHSHQGRSHTHHTGVAGGQWKKRAQTTIRGFKPNLHFMTLSVRGAMKRVRACTDCIKRSKFDAKKNVPVATI